MTDLADIMQTVQLETERKRIKATKRGDKSRKLHEKFAFDCRARGLPTMHVELPFALEALERRWRFDYAIPKFMVAIELEGLVMQPVYMQPRPGAQRRFVCMGRHATPDGIKEDMLKYNSAAMLGWFVLRFEQDAIKSSLAVDTTLRVLHARGWRP